MMKILKLFILLVLLTVGGAAFAVTLPPFSFFGAKAACFVMVTETYTVFARRKSFFNKAYWDGVKPVKPSSTITQFFKKVKFF